MKKFYLGVRHNPQLKNPYVKKYGQLSIKEAKKKSDCAYGSMNVYEFETEEEYLKQLAEYAARGWRVS